MGWETTDRDGAARSRRRRGAAIGVSVVAHLLVLAAVGLMTPRLNYRVAVEPQAVNLILLPPVQERPKRRTAASSRPAAQAAAPGVHRPPVAQGARPSGDNPSPIVNPAPAPLPAEEGGRGVRALLRGTVGCDSGYVAHLTAEEKAACAERFAKGAIKAAPFSGIPEEKRAYYDAIQKRYQTMHMQGAPVGLVARGAMGMFEDESRMIGGQMVGHGGGVGCGMQFGPGAGKKDTRSLSDRIKQDAFVGVGVGPLKCGVVIPQGSLTPDIGIKPP